MSLADAIDATQQLKTALMGELEGARHERTLLRSLAHEALMARAAAREAFNVTSRHLTARMSQGLEWAARTFGLQAVTLDALRAHAPAEADALASALADVRALSAALAELDALNRHLAERALGVVRAYTTQLAPTPAAYDRRGARPAGEQRTQSRRA